ncbi:MAG TPA: M6 family metalloprotease domain-containing protein [Bacteroidales bacterium]|nr:M6 family metalloprotease domain-containing protein [Bacteroidales bacterium]
MLAFFSTLKASYFEKRPYLIKQPDGEEIQCFITGDEFYHRIHDKDDYTIIQAPDGYYYYALQEGDLVKPSAFKVNSVDPSGIGLKKGIKISASEYNLRYSITNEYKSSRKGSLKAPVNGTLNNVVIFIKFADDPEFSTPRQEYTNLFNAETGQSMKAYFREVSYSKLTINSILRPASSTEVNNSYMDYHNRNYFLVYNATTNPDGYRNWSEKTIREQTLVSEAVKWVNDNSPVPADLDIDADDDQLIDNVCFIVRGYAAEWSELLWGHMTYLYMNDVYINGKKISNYTFQPENQADLRVMCHEMSHSLGSPDLYHYNNQGFIRPVGYWDLMEFGTGHMLAYMKWKYSNKTWISDIPEIESSGTYRLNPLTSEENNCYKIKSPVSDAEYFMVEYRHKSGDFESNLPGSGLLVYRINESIMGGNRDGPPDEVYIFRPGGSTTVNGSCNEAYLCQSSGRTSINDNSDPRCFLQNGDKGGLVISQIREENGQMVFDVVIPGIQQPFTGDYYINEWNEIDIVVSAPGDAEYYVEITGIGDHSRPGWIWRNDKTPADEEIGSDAVSLSLSDKHAFIFSFLPTNADNRIHVNLFRRNQSGAFSLYQENEFDLSARFRTPDLTPPRITEIGSNASVTSNIILQFSENIRESTLKENISLSGSRSGRIDFSLTYSAPVTSVIIDPIADFRYDEIITLSLSTGIQDIAGLSLDGDGNGSPGPGLSHTFRTEGQVFAHDFSVVSLLVADTLPLFGEEITVDGIIRNEGTSAEAANQKVVFMVDDHQETEISLPVPMIPGQDYNVQFKWPVGMHRSALKIKCILAEDQNNTNDEKILYVTPLHTGYILINGKIDNELNVSMVPGSKKMVELELVNNDIARIDASANTAGTYEWISLSAGRRFTLSGLDTATYAFEISVPPEVQANTTSMNFIRFTYGFDKNSQLNMTINVIRPELTVNPDLVNLGPDAGEHGRVDVRSNTGWIARDNADWLNLSVTNGNGDGSVSISALSRNPFPGERSADVFFSAPGSDTIKTRVTQKGYDVATSIRITGNRSVIESSGCSYKCIAHYDNGFMEDVTSSARWSVNHVCATIAGGVLTTTNVDSDQVCLISAVYNNLSDTFRLVIKESITTSVNEPAILEFLAYPNPAISHIYLKAEVPDQEFFNVEIHDINGELLFSERMNCSEGIIRLDVTALKTGMYIIEIRNRKMYGKVNMIKL